MLKVQSNPNIATLIVHRRVWRKIEGVNKNKYCIAWDFVHRLSRTVYRGLTYFPVTK